jgi:mRNA interferase YafQ
MSSKRKGKDQSSSNPKNEKRVDPPLKMDYTSQFEKDWAAIKKAGRQDLRRAKAGMMLLAGGEDLPAQYRDHELNGEWANHREFHAGGDFLVIYYRKGDVLFFDRIGTHAELFE